MPKSIGAAKWLLKKVHASLVSKCREIPLIGGAHATYGNSGEVSTYSYHQAHLITIEDTTWALSLGFGKDGKGATWLPLMLSAFPVELSSGDRVAIAKELHYTISTSRAFEHALFVGRENGQITTGSRYSEFCWHSKTFLLDTFDYGRNNVPNKLVESCERDLHH
jgi:hypothetical protein